MQRIVFTKHPESYSSADSYVAHIPNFQSKEDLLRQLSARLKFPDYFGHNWDALSECLRDFHWIEQEQIVIVHDEYPALDKQALTQYLRILFDAVQDWKQGEDHSLTAVFGEEFRDIVGSTGSVPM